MPRAEPEQRLAWCAQLFAWAESLGIFNVLVGTMLRSDVFRFMLMFVPMLIGFGAALTALFPNASDERVGSLYSTIENLIILSLIGEPPEVGGTIYPTILMADQQSDRPLNAMMYYLLYLAFLVLVLVLLLNLLIAMMGRTYNVIQASATLLWRQRFARLVLRLELLASFFPVPRSSAFARAVREPTVWPAWLSQASTRSRYSMSYMANDGAYTYAFRTYDRIAGQSLMLHGLRGDPFETDDGPGEPMAPRLATSHWTDTGVSRAVSGKLLEQMRKLQATVDGLAKSGDQVGEAGTLRAEAPLAAPPPIQAPITSPLASLVTQAVSAAAAAPSKWQTAHAADGQPQSTASGHEARRVPRPPPWTQLSGVYEDGAMRGGGVSAFASPIDGWDHLAHAASRSQPVAVEGMWHAHASQQQHRPPPAYRPFRASARCSPLPPLPISPRRLAGEPTGGYSQEGVVLRQYPNPSSTYPI